LVELISDLLTLTLQFMPNHCMPFGNLPNIAAEGFSYDTKVSLDLFHFFIAHWSQCIGESYWKRNGKFSHPIENGSILDER